jgi:hypothetical protein
MRGGRGRGPIQGGGILGAQAVDEANNSVLFTEAGAKGVHKTAVHVRIPREGEGKSQPECGKGKALEKVMTMYDKLHKNNSVEIDDREGSSQSH